MVATYLMVHGGREMTFMLTTRESRLRLTAEIRGLRLWKIRHHADNGYVLSQGDIRIVERASLAEIEAVLSGDQSYSWPDGGRHSPLGGPAEDTEAGGG